MLRTLFGFFRLTWLVFLCHSHYSLLRVWLRFLEMKKILTIKHNNDQIAEVIKLRMNASAHPGDITCIKERLF